MNHRLLFCLLAAAPAAFAQTPPLPPDSPLPRLLAERRLLTEQYARAREQRHGLFGLTGKPSKQDLQEVVTSLQGIVDKDEEIVAVLGQSTRQAQTTASTLQNTSRDDRNVSAQRLAELQNELQRANERARQATQRQQELTADLAEVSQGRQHRDLYIGGLAVVCLGLLLWRRRR